MITGKPALDGLRHPVIEVLDQGLDCRSVVLRPIWSMHEDAVRLQGERSRASIQVDLRLGAFKLGTGETAGAPLALPKQRAARIPSSECTFKQPSIVISSLLGRARHVGC